LTSRLAAGLVVGILPLSPDGRRNFLEDRFRRRRLEVGPPVLAWLGRHCGGSARQLEGAVARVEGLSRLRGGVPTLEEIVALFYEEAATRELTVERIASTIGAYFQVTRHLLKSRRRSRNALLPRQVGMYLARRLTGLSLGQIGAYFGGRDHSTVLHACRKIEEAIQRDAGLGGLVRQLVAEVA
jgi:chromosomal replication initiator protein